jgi:hypothetical protein
LNDSGESNIPHLYIKETTEMGIWLLGSKLSKIWIRCKYTSYAVFFNGLLGCEHHIELLKEKGVIVNELNKSNEDLLALFHTISKGLSIWIWVIVRFVKGWMFMTTRGWKSQKCRKKCYSEICERLNVYYDYKVEYFKRRILLIPLFIMREY